MRGLSREGNLRFKIAWAYLIVEKKFTVFALYLRAISPEGGGGGGGVYLEGLIFGILRYYSLNAGLFRVNWHPNL